MFSLVILLSHWPKTVLCSQNLGDRVKHEDLAGDDNNARFKARIGNEAGIGLGLLFSGRATLLLF